jgi:hypothetical protein
MGFFKSGPGQELRAASQMGKPTLEPESESSSGVDILTGGDQTRKTGTGTGIVATVTPGSGGETTGAAENVAPPADGGTPNSEAQTDPNAVAAPADANNPAAASDSANGSGTPPAGTADAAPKTDTAPAQNGDKKKESTSKKKKGLRKIVPW